MLFKLRDYEPAEIRMVGTAPLPGVKYQKQLRGGRTVTLPVRARAAHLSALLALARV